LGVDDFCLTSFFSSNTYKLQDLTQGSHALNQFASPQAWLSQSPASVLVSFKNDAKKCGLGEQAWRRAQSFVFKHMKDI
jgi:hypothetical protein